MIIRPTRKVDQGEWYERVHNIKKTLCYDIKGFYLWITLAGKPIWCHHSGRNSSSSWWESSGSNEHKDFCWFRFYHFSVFTYTFVSLVVNVKKNLYTCLVSDSWIVHPMKTNFKTSVIQILMCGWEGG